MPMTKRGGEKLRRHGKPHSKQGCQFCLDRHIKCDEGEPSCERCLKAGLHCPGLRKRVAVQPEPGEEGCLVPVATLHLSTNPSVDRGQPEGQTFHQFVNVLVPLLGQYEDPGFWFQCVVPAAQRNDEVFSATVAVAALYEMPVEKTIPQYAHNQYQQAVTWYRKSLQSSFKNTQTEQSLQFLTLTLINTLLYLKFEIRQAHYNNQRGLLRAAFTLIYSARQQIWDSKNSQILDCISALLGTSVVTAMISSTAIPSTHWNIAITLALKLSAELDVPEVVRLRYELLNLMHRLNNIVSSTEQLDLDLDYQLQDFYRRLVKCEASLEPTFEAQIPAIGLRCLMLHTQVLLSGYRYGLEADRTTLETRLLGILSLFEQKNSVTKDPDGRWFVDIAVVPACLFVAWYWRDMSIYPRIKALIEWHNRDPENKAYLRIVLSYMEELLQTGRDEATELELELFGDKPPLLLRWHLHRCAHQLAQRALSATL